MTQRTFICGRCGEVVEVTGDTVEDELLAHGQTCKKKKRPEISEPPSDPAEPPSGAEDFTGIRSRRRGPRERRKK